MAVAVAELVASAISSSSCTVTLSACADAAECAAILAPCSGPGVEGTLACCSEQHVCASMFGSESFRCVNRAVVDNSDTAEVLECP